MHSTLIKWTVGRVWWTMGTYKFRCVMMAIARKRWVGEWMDKQNGNGWVKMLIVGWSITSCVCMYTVNRWVVKFLWFGVSWTQAQNKKFHCKRDKCIAEWNWIQHKTTIHIHKLSQRAHLPTLQDWYTFCIEYKMKLQMYNNWLWFSFFLSSFL